MIAFALAQFQVLVPPTTHPPTIDGVLAQGEWDSAAIIDISDTLGVDGNPEEPGDCLVYVVHDRFYLYMAFDCLKDTALSGHSQPSAAFDDDNSGKWPKSDTTEGINALGSDNGWFCSWWLEDFTWGGWYPANQVIYSFSEGLGHVVCEWAIYLLSPHADSGPQFIGTNAVSGWEDTIGVHLFYADDEWGLIGYWPQNLSPWYDPAGYGEFILFPGGTVSEGGVLERPLLSVPPVVSGSFEAMVYLPAPARVSLSVYSPSGALMAHPVEGLCGPGTHTIPIPKMPSGAFFLRAEVGNSVLLKKVLVIR
ncbi:MAG: hypothetical protein ABIM88_02060 [candidate division WOR-3 bacterium]